jgi:NAD(P)-dependent dehydrogenase (short-subunit alcohol dehydrogenase family)
MQLTTPQIPLGTGFGHHATAMEVISGIDLSGKTALVTGGYSGIGTEAVKALVSAGARVIVAARRPEEADKSLADIRSRIDVVKLDLSDPASINACAETVSGMTGKLDILINNAGIMAAPLSRDARGFEAQFATNHLGHFQLTARLWPLLAKAGNARAVALTSAAHKRFAPNVADPNFTACDYEKWAAYGQAKSANALFALELDRLAAPHGVRAFAVHPGAIVTNLGRHLSDAEKSAMSPNRTSDKMEDEPSETKPKMGGLEWKNAEAGAATSVWAATSPLLEGKGGVYCNDSDIARLIEGPEEYNEFGVMPHVRDTAVAQQLWAISEEMTGVKFRP